MNILFDCYAIDIQMENHLHCIVPNDEMYQLLEVATHWVKPLWDNARTKGKWQLQI